VLKSITPVILTYNEAANIARTLACLAWAERVVVLDSGSTDDTENLVRSFANSEWHVRPFDSHAGQCNFALDHLVVRAPWVLFMDADYQMPASSVTEMAELNPDEMTSGYQVKFSYCVDGCPLTGALYPPRTVLFQPEKGRYAQEGHAHILRLEGQVLSLDAHFLHDDRKPVEHFLTNQRKYAALEARWLWARPMRELRWSDRARRVLVLAPWLAPAMALFWRGGVRDGWRGWRYAGERALAESLVSWELLKRMIGRSKA
jgi:glycosyltransferase involved in cell wall biosynthesis